MLFYRIGIESLQQGQFFCQKETDKLIQNKSIDTSRKKQLIIISDIYNYLYKQQNSYIKILLDIITLLFIILNLVYIPIELSFSINSREYTPLYVATSPLSLIMFLFEIICHLNTAIYVNGLIISDRKEIIKSYFKKLLWWDLFIIIPLAAGIYFDIKILKLIVVLRFFDILHLVQDIEDRFQFKDRFRGQLQLFKLMAFILCLAHLIACTWNKLAVIEYGNGYSVTWIGGIVEGQNVKFLKQYIKSIYWTIVTMTTLGYGDITPQTESNFIIEINLMSKNCLLLVEQVFATSIGLLSTVVFAFSVSMIGEILKDISKRDSEFRSKMSMIETYMNKRKLNQQLQVKVRKYFDYLHKEEQEDTYEGIQLLQKLASSLKEEVFVDMYGRLLKSKKIFDLHFSQGFLNQLALKMKEMRLGPEEIIFRENEPGNKIYFILKGEVQMLLNMKQECQNYHMLCSLKEGQIFGEVEFFSGLIREITARTVNVTSLVYVEYEDFIETVKAFPEDYEQVLQTKDNINLYSKSKGLDHKCFSCSSYDHRLKSCPLVNYIPNRVKIMYNFNLYQDQQRSEDTSRRDFRAGKTLRQLKYLKQSAMRLHFYLYNEQLLNEDECSQFDFEVDSDDNFGNQSNSIVYQQSPQQMIEKSRQAGMEIPKGFMLNNSFIAAETPKHSSKIARINTLLMKGGSKHYSRSNTNKFLNGLPVSEPTSNGTNASVKQDSKSKFYRQTHHISQIPSVHSAYESYQSPKLQRDKELEFSDHNGKLNTPKAQIPFHPSPPISNIHDKSMKEESQNDDFNNINPQTHISDNNIQIEKTDFYQDNKVIRKKSKESSMILRQQKMELRIETPRRKSNLFPITTTDTAENKMSQNSQNFANKISHFESDNQKTDMNKQSLSTIHQNMSSQPENEYWNQIDNNTEVHKSHNQIYSQNSWRNLKNVNFEKIKPNVLNMERIQSQQQTKNEDISNKRDMFDSPDLNQAAHMKEMLPNNLTLFKKYQQKQDKTFKQALKGQINKENNEITSLEEILSLANSPQKDDFDKQTQSDSLKTDELSAVRNQRKQDQNVNQNSHGTLTLGESEQNKEYAKFPQQLRQQDTFNEREHLQIKQDVFNFQSSSSASSQIDKPYNNLKVDVKSPESPPPAQERMKKKKKNKRAELKDFPSPPALKLLKVPIGQENHNNSQLTNYGENLTTQRTTEKGIMGFDGDANGIMPNFNESNIQHSHKVIRPSIFQSNSLISAVNKINKKGSRESQNSQLILSQSSIDQSSSESESSSSSSHNTESLGNQSNCDKKKMLTNNDHSHVNNTNNNNNNNNFEGVKPQIKIIRDDEEIISDYKQFKKNLKESPTNLSNIGQPNGVKNNNLLGSNIPKQEYKINTNKNLLNFQYGHHLEHDTPQFECQKNQFQKNFNFKLSNIASNSQKEKKINRSYQDQQQILEKSSASSAKQSNFRINLNQIQNSPQKPLSSYQGSSAPSQSNHKLEQMKSSPCIPQEMKTLQNQVQFFHQIHQQSSYASQLVNLNHMIPNNPNILMRQNSRAIELTQKQNVGNKIQNLRRTDTLTTNNSPIIHHQFTQENKKGTFDNIPAPPGSTNQINPQTHSIPYQMINQFQADGSPIPLEILEREDLINLRIIRDSVENFDKFKIFKKYFVHNNLDIIINQINKKRKNKAIVQRIRQYNIRKKKTLIAVSKLNLKRRGGVTEGQNPNLTSANLKKHLTSLPQRNHTFQITCQTPQSETIPKQTFDDKSINLNNQKQTEASKQNNVINTNFENPTQPDQPFPQFNSDQNLLSQKNVGLQRKSIFFMDKGDKLDEDNHQDDKQNLITPNQKINLLTPNVNEEFHKYISKSADSGKMKSKDNYEIKLNN